MKRDGENILSTVKLRQTPIRKQVLAVLEASIVPIDVQTIHKNLQQKEIKADIVTIYRILEVFVAKGIVRSILLDSHKQRFELTSLPHHHHFTCQNCGSISDISDCELEQFQTGIEKRKQIKIRSHRLEFSGLCFQCLLTEKG